MGDILAGLGVLNEGSKVGVDGTVGVDGAMGVTALGLRRLGPEPALRGLIFRTSLNFSDVADSGVLAE